MSTLLFYLEMLIFSIGLIIVLFFGFIKIQLI
uniref:Cytochrome b6-f complex subunit 6 n=4 Tax=Caulerpa TaxID=76312 RepID=A0A2P0QIH8_9CHLO|nr:cytochrome b6-f complex subunit 6 [Caulerpa racemosa]YP_009472797.1 cytochrome b6-f complex subunit 6 [Caulerpa manorensis]YP_009729393.1 cytochrome b6-f complex subunit 6 [Caulerpa ashmeadii]YP_010502224.1 cytochrome b6-f complex subunit 6 [Caulerpa taxifolia]AYO45679.1 cytochrome b6-f complex subunit 6 [Caulerpa cupressoides]ANJ70752.1 cytochrome b6-f complex subunit 6 [Caulerpa racemosa]ARO74543.1 cytochrome b6-f complex subunit 6 [Caulerpa manorensis]QHQ73305.1 cytochrome b6-f complex